MSDKLNIDNKLIVGIVDLSRHKEFYGHIVQQIERVFVSDDHPVETAAVGRIHGERFIKMYLNRSFFTSLYTENGNEKGWTYMMGVLEHEILHICLGHLFMNFEDRQRGNVAKDCVVNGLIPKEKLPENHVNPETYGMPTNKSTMWYYTHLLGNPTYKKQCKDGDFGKDGFRSHIMSSHSVWEDVKDDGSAKEFLKDIVRKSKELCDKHYGDVPASLIDQIDDLLKNAKQIVPWNKVLRTFSASCAESVLGYTMQRISRRFNTRPGIRKEDVLHLAVAIDTSRSIQDEQLKTFFNEIKWVWKNGAKITIYEADCAIAAVYPFKGKFNGKIHGRGGTDLEPVLKEVEGKYDGLIYFTDFYAPVITKKYRIPTLWVLHTDMPKSEYPVKWGLHIRIEK